MTNLTTDDFSSRHNQRLAELATLEEGWYVSADGSSTSGKPIRTEALKAADEILAESELKYHVSPDTSGSVVLEAVFNIDEYFFNIILDVHSPATIDISYFSDKGHDRNIANTVQEAVELADKYFNICKQEASGVS